MRQEQQEEEQEEPLPPDENKPDDGGVEPGCSRPVARGSSTVNTGEPPEQTRRLLR
ncbi:Hypothetical predicted protein [Xyrichtys novacula]|uniref:Uncharacterized protein n=1 Tax=Xyrichtys novacula TaxID=13765 RepID=A0AAV1HIL0_XYRNO|nr:Hypothetical predicted protein [Xyrichtys novacula]